MSLVNELGVALKVTAHVFLQGRFWAAMGRALFNIPLLIAIAVLLGFSRVGARQIIASGLSGTGIWMALAAIVCILLLFPLLMRAWCPVVARAVAQALQLDAPEVPLPSLGRFIGAWILVMVIGLLLLVPFIFVPRPFSWIMLLPAALLVSGYQVRCALCIHGGPQDTQAVVAATMVRRTLLWTPLCAVPTFLYDKGAAVVEGWIVSPYEFTSSTTSDLVDLIGLAGHMAVFALVLVLWAALSLQALEQRAAWRTLGGRQRRTAAPAPTQASPAAPADVGADRAARSRAPSARTWLLALAAVLVVGAAGGYAQRLALLHYYLSWTDADYKSDIAIRPEGPDTDLFLSIVLEKSACAGRLPRIEKMLKVGFKPNAKTLGTALNCAARHDHIDLARYLIERGADVNSVLTTFMTDNPAPITPLQFAVARRNGALVDLLLSKNADATLQGPDQANRAPGPLHYAARNRDMDMIRILIKARARPDAPTPKTPIFYFVEASAPEQDGSAAGWALVITKAERAGLSTSGTDTDGGNLLHWAASRGQIGLIEVLLARGVDRHQQEKEGAYAFQRLAAWYQYSKVEPGPQLEFALKALSGGVRDINTPASFLQQRTDTSWQRVDKWTIARVAAAKPRVRAVFGTLIDYSMLDAGLFEQAWPLLSMEQAAQLVADLSAAQLAASPSLPIALRAKGWGDLAAIAESKR